MSMYVVILDYPGSPFSIGDTLYEDGDNFTNQGPICMGIRHTGSFKVVGWDSSIDPKKTINKKEIVKYPEIFEEFKTDKP